MVTPEEINGYSTFHALCDQEVKPRPFIGYPIIVITLSSNNGSASPEYRCNAHFQEICTHPCTGTGIKTEVLDEGNQPYFQFTPQGTQPDSNAGIPESHYPPKDNQE